MTDWMEFPSSSASGVQVSEEPAGTNEYFFSLQESRCVPLDVEMIDQLLILEALCPRAQMDYATFSSNSMNLESVLDESLQHYGIKRDVLFHQQSWQHHACQF